MNHLSHKILRVVCLRYTGYHAVMSYNLSLYIILLMFTTSCYVHFYCFCNIPSPQQPWDPQILFPVKFPTPFIFFLGFKQPLSCRFLARVKASEVLYSKLSLRRTPSGPVLSVLERCPAYREFRCSKMTEKWCAGTNTGCPFYRGVRLIEVSVKRELTV